MIMLMAPPTSPSSMPSFAYPVTSVSPAGPPWHSKQDCSMVSRCTKRITGSPSYSVSS